MFFHGTLCVIFKDNLPMHEYSFIDNILSPPTHVTEKNDFEIQMTAYLVEAKKKPYIPRLVRGKILPQPDTQEKWDRYLNINFGEKCANKNM